MLRWPARLGLLLAAFAGPVIGYWVRVRQTGNAEAAVDGLLWGLALSVAALIAFALTFQTSPWDRLRRVGIAALGVFASWGLFLWVVNFLPTLV